MKSGLRTQDSGLRTCNIDKEWERGLWQVFLLLIGTISLGGISAAQGDESDSQLQAAKNAATSSQIGEFCPQCTNETTARQTALTLAPTPVCDYGNPPRLPPVSCTTVSRRVILGNHVSRQKFAYVVTSSGFAAPTAVSDTLSATEIEVLDKIFDLRADWESIEWGQTVDDGTVFAGDAGAIALAAPGYLIRGPDCPVGTALDHVLDQNIQNLLLDAIQLNIERALQNRYSGLSAFARRLTGIGLTIRGVGFTLSWETNNPNSGIYTFLFPNSEVSSPIPDMLVYRVDLRGETPDGRPVLDIKFEDNLSRAAGAIVRRLLNGQVTIDNACVVEKLEELQNRTNI